ncbi:MAG: hypothetical protein H6738_03855 [Alphaproteobacteria bacterium]|nr:hypothetical protein [Alphaproteobacteria bacterium]MCB9695904.1 hypothetical protein [Alphaproteobacteria bacterium]
MKWTWNADVEVAIDALVARPPHDLDWCADLESSAEDAVVGKVLCTGAAVAMARVVIGSSDPSGELDRCLAAVERWVDDPSESNFSALLSARDVCDTDTPDASAVWWAIRTALCSVGNREAEWALSSVADAMERAGVGAPRAGAKKRRCLDDARAQPSSASKDTTVSSCATSCCSAVG